MSDHPPPGEPYIPSPSDPMLATWSTIPCASNVPAMMLPLTYKVPLRRRLPSWSREMFVDEAFIVDPACKLIEPVDLISMPLAVISTELTF